MKPAKKTSETEPNSHIVLAPEQEDELYLDYPNEPIGGGNPYYRCRSCGASAPQINGTLDGHFSGCEWATQKKREMDAAAQKSHVSARERTGGSTRRDNGCEAGALIGTAFRPTAEHYTRENWLAWRIISQLSESGLDVNTSPAVQVCDVIHREIVSWMTEHEMSKGLRPGEREPSSNFKRDFAKSR